MNSLAQSASKPETAFDFWVGEWVCKGRSRNAPGKDEWTVTNCKNSIKRTLKGNVIEESFSMPGFAGKSWTVFHQNKKKWVQTWVDDSGSYLTLEGGIEGGEMVLHQLMPSSTQVQMKMRFTQVKKDSFLWLWQRSADSGKTWETQWELNYLRK